MKSVFEKTGARTRGELCASLLFGEHRPRIEHHVPVGDDASFVDAQRGTSIASTWSISRRTRSCLV